MEYEDQTDLGNSLTKLTPILTNLAQNSVIINQYYSQEVCTPARASLLTGRYPISVGMQYGVIEPYSPWALNLNETTVAEVLQDVGYDTYAYGKWHLGHHTERYLPTARGFGEFVGYLNGDNFYYDKVCPNEDNYVDFIYSNASCYMKAPDKEAFQEYSTAYYTNKAIEVIEEHTKEDANPFFLYLAYQAVHAPFYQSTFTTGDYASHTLALASNQSLASSVVDGINGVKAQMYALTLNVLDDNIGRLMDTLETYDMTKNTYVIFASDNGGCYLNGGKNAPLRGSKASLFEGGTKVDAFIYAPTFLPESSSYSASGTTYNNLFHVSDWFPTILDMAGIEYTPPTGFDLDGVSHYNYLMGDMDDTSGVGPRQYMLYNAYTKVMTAAGTYSFDLNSDAVFAVRDSRYKLMHTFNGSALTQYYSGEDEYSDDGDLSEIIDCKQETIYSGDYVKYLFDLQEDPYETNNLYDSTDDTIVGVISNLYSQFDEMLESSTADWSSDVSNRWETYCETVAIDTWKSNDYTITSFLPVSWDGDFIYLDKSYPSYCGNQ